MSSVFADGFFGEKGLLAHAVGDFGEFALVGTDGGKIVHLADEVESAKGFPNLLVARIDAGQFGPYGHARSRCHRNRPDAPADRRTQLHRLLMSVSEFDDEAALMDGGSHLVRVDHVARNGSSNSGRLQEGDDLRTTGSISKADQRKGGVAADHRGLILKHLEESLVKAGSGSILAHNPGIGIARFLGGIRRQPDHFWIPARRAGVVASHALAELDEGMLDSARMLFVPEVFADLFVGELAAKPGVPPEQEGHEDDQPGGNEKERAIPRGHLVMRGRSALLRRIFHGDYRRGDGFERRGWTGHVFSWSLVVFGRRRRLV